MDGIYTVSDLLNAAAEAYYAADTDRLEELRSVANDWLQPYEETSAQVNMLEAFIDAIESHSVYT